MISPLEGLPSNVLGVEATGKVTDDDYEKALAPAVRAMLESQERIRFLYVLGEEFDGWSMGALWQDAKLGLKSPRSWEKIAIVSDDDRVRHTIKAFGWMMPGDLRIFDLADLAAAKDWVAN